MQEYTLKDIISCKYFSIKLESDFRNCDIFNELKPKSKIQNITIFSNENETTTTSKKKKKIAFDEKYKFSAYYMRKRKVKTLIADVRT